MRLDTRLVHELARDLTMHAINSAPPAESIAAFTYALAAALAAQCPGESQGKTIDNIAEDLRELVRRFMTGDEAPYEMLRHVVYA